MHINLEAADRHAVQAYSNDKIQINSSVYESSLIVSRDTLISSLTITSIKDMDDAYLDLILRLNPEVVIIGHDEVGVLPPYELISTLAQQRIGIECMSLGAACRTYNVLLSEQRSVVAGFIL